MLLPLARRPLRLRIRIPRGRRPFSLSPSAQQCIGTVLVVKKPHDPRTTDAAAGIIRFLTERSGAPERIWIERDAVRDLQDAGITVDAASCPVRVLDRHPSHGTPAPPLSFPTFRSTPPEDPTCSVPSLSRHPLPPIDLIITLGGDGTILHLSSLYSTAGRVPPVLSFSMGSLGFLLPFHIDRYRETLTDVWNGHYAIRERMRLACQVFDAGGQTVSRCAGASTGWQVMNEVALHRGRYPHLSVVDAYVNAQHLTEAVADGLILATPTGSTAYSLSSGGPIVHPNVRAFLLTPIAPRSLSFRTLLLPDESVIKMQISAKSRAPSELSMDGREVCILHPGEHILVRKSAFPIPCIVPRDGGDGWVADINSLLQFNVGFKNSALQRGHTPV